MVVSPGYLEMNAVAVRISAEWLSCNVNVLLRILFVEFPIQTPGIVAAASAVANWRA